LRLVAIVAVIAGGSILLAPAAAASQGAQAPERKRPQLSAEELADIGFTVSPNTTDWGLPVARSA
jgi:hypothetical protein